MENENEIQGTPAPPTDPEPRKVAGFCWCPKCFMDDKYEVCQVRVNVKGKVYYTCPTHSIDLCTSKAGQDWLLRNMVDAPEKLKKRDIKNDPPPAPPNDPPKKGGFLNSIIDW